MSAPGRRAFVVVMDACGVGALPDADAYGDAGSDTLGHLAERVGGLDLPALGALGLGNVAPIAGVPPSSAPAVHGRLHRQGPGKDSTTGHWELMGAVAPAPLPTYPDGVPGPLLERLQQVTGHVYCANVPLNGMTAIEEWGAHHLATGELILYTSADSVVQIAAHVDVLDEAALHATCALVRAQMTGPDAVGRVIARPFRGSPGAFERTDGRRDLAVPPPEPTTVDAAHAAGVPVHTVGKAGELLSLRGVDVAHKGATNAVALAATDDLVADLPAGLVLVNLVDTDQVHGHRKDAEGFASALQTIDRHAAGWVAALRPGDLLVLTADHGVDLAAAHSDHTREHVPLLATWPGAPARRHDGPMADVGQSARAWLGIPAAPRGSAFVP